MRYLETFLVVSIVATVGLCWVFLLGIFMIVGDWQAGLGGGGFLAGLLAYIALLFGLPIAGLIALKRHYRRAMALQIAWLIAASPVILLALRSAIPPTT